jgi:hypothetical protein|nr:MAG TPA: hypothetical protein [Caudoviricetes sp.]
MKITAKQFVEDFKENNVQNTKINEHAVEDYIREELEIKEYIPFMEKCRVLEEVVIQSVVEEDGVKRVNPVSQYICFVIAMLVAHTSLDIDKNNPIDDYDILCEAGLLELIVMLFQKDYDECKVVLDMLLSQTFEDNNFNIIVGKFLNGILNRLDIFTDTLKESIGNMDLTKLLGADFKEEDLVRLHNFLETYSK